PLVLTGGFKSEITIEELMKHLKGPDFPTGANIYNPEDIREVYLNGKGRILMRATTEIEEVKDRNRIVITEIPYQVNKSKLIIDIANLVKDKKVIGITDIRDESDRRGMRVVIELKRGTRAKSILNNLYKFTDLQCIFSANMVALVDNTPQICNLKVLLSEYTKHRQLVIVRRSQYELKAAKLRAHILEGLKIALDNLDEVIQTIRSSKDTDTARTNLMTKFGLSQIQAEAILDMQLRRLSALERQKIDDEYKQILANIEDLTALLLSPKKILNVISEELKILKETYADKRKTKIHGSLVQMSEEDLIPNNPILITVTKTGYVKRIPRENFRSQQRGGKGVNNNISKSEDEMAFIVAGNNHDDVLFFTNKGKVFQVKAYNIPEANRLSKGQAVINLINIEQGEKIKTIIPIPDLAESKGFLVLATRQGAIKKTEINRFAKIKVNGIIAIKLNTGDQLIDVKTTDGDDEIFMVSYKGKAIRFHENDARPMGRATKGVRGITLKPDDYVVCLETFPAKEDKPDDGRKKYFRDLLVVTEKGLGKRTPVSLFPLHKRASTGVKIAKLTPKTGNIAAAEVVVPAIEQCVISTKKGQVIKMPLKNIKQIGRNTQGVILMKCIGDDCISDMTCLVGDGTDESTEPVKTEN
ncbi:DNA gyrase subunit A, partial [Candidatus Beckwithbacteria bacterium]|nr:DNA gyrase subunit A [Candidatus Beckwithbacteria bacterium]